jgi:hypothetical protein
LPPKQEDELAEHLAAADAGSAFIVEFGHLTGFVTLRDRMHPDEGTSTNG